MKIVSSIFAALILFLTIQPVMVQSDFLAVTKTKSIKTCCSDKQKTNSSKNKIQQKRNKGCCNNGHCDNPFLTCANCFFIILEKPSFLNARIFIQSEKVRLINDRILSTYLQDVWHPPKTV